MAIRLGSEVEYSEDRGNGTVRKVRGRIVGIERDGELLLRSRHHYVCAPVIQ
jgi:hypothetical protein